jgi:hypothetical protein
MVSVEQKPGGAVTAPLLEKSLSDLASQEVPRETVLNAPVVTADNVDQYLDRAFES